MKKVLFKKKTNYKINVILWTIKQRLYSIIQINQPTRCNSFTSLLLDIYMWLNMFQAPLCPSSGAYKCTRSLWFYRWSVVVGASVFISPVIYNWPHQPLPSNGKTRGS
jgi:hypothetical protein